VDIRAIQDRYIELTSFLYNLSRFYIHTLHKSEDAMKYCAGRNLSLEKLSTFDIGLAPDPSTTKSFLKLNSISESYLFDTGVWVSPDNPFDLFSGRLIFPLKDVSGNIVGFSGRQWVGDVKRAKYINTPTTEIFQKSLLLYNLHNAMPSIHSLGYVVLVEGMMDVITLYSIGQTNVVAPCGTAFTEEQIRLLGLFTKNFIICYDKDKAGVEATAKSTALCASISSEISIKVLTLVPPVISTDPNLKLDPDSYVNNYGAVCFFNLIRQLFVP
jgi:DNA primase